MDWMGFGRVGESGVKLCFCCHYGQIHNEVRDEEGHESEVEGPVMVIQAFGDDEKVAWSFRTCSSGM